MLMTQLICHSQKKEYTRFVRAVKIVGGLNTCEGSE